MRDPRSIFHHGYWLPAAGSRRSFQKVTQEFITQEAWNLSWYLMYGLYGLSLRSISLRTLDAEITEECAGLCRCITSFSNVRLRILLALQRTAGYSHMEPLVRKHAAHSRDLDQSMLSFCNSIDFYVVLYRPIASTPITYQSFRYVRGVCDALYRSVCLSLGVPVQRADDDVEQESQEKW
jgi:hypothetical protein